MHIRLGFLGAVAVPCLLTIALGEAAYGQTVNRQNPTRQPGYTYLNCDGFEAECLVSETPVPGVRIVRQKDYPQRPAHYLSSNLYTTLAADRETGNRFNAFDFQVAVEGGPLPHTHRNEWEMFFVSNGNLKFAELDPNPPYNFDFVDVSSSTVVYGPQGPVHGFQNKTTIRGRIFSFAMPSGLDNFFHNAGSEVVDFNAPIPPITTEEIVRTAFWAEQRGDGLWFLGPPPPVLRPDTPQLRISSSNDSNRPVETGPFGDRRVVLLTPTEVGNITAATAFCGPGVPGRAGGSVKYSYLSLPTQRSDFPANFTSQNTEVFYTLSPLSFSFGGSTSQTVTVETGTFLQIEPGVAFSIANLKVDGQPTSSPAQSLAITIIPPVCPPPPVQAQTTAVAGPKNLSTTSRSIQLDGSKSASADGRPLTYLWTIPQGNPAAGILSGSTATPIVQFTQGHVAYTFQLTVTDSAGKSASDLVKVDYAGN
jgi:mannose-6-phosphate isomerase-like protein (cupin superfamily)